LVLMLLLLFVYCVSKSSKRGFVDAVVKQACRDDVQARFPKDRRAWDEPSR